ncbi:MAG: A24 family peptidase [Aquisalinus sp.]|nr:A24 family peptidase [Aquisalinus sp.]
MPEIVSIPACSLVFLLGLTIGSFLNVVIHRGPAIWGLAEAPPHDETYSLAYPRSHCPTCHQQIKAVHLIPILGFVLLRGRCEACSERISWRYPVVEVLGGASALVPYFVYGPSAMALAIFIFFCLLVPLAFIDQQTSFLPDALTLPLIVTGFAANAVVLFVPLQDALIGAAAGFISFWLIGEAFYRLRGYDGLGLGDAKMLAGLGAWLGSIALPFIVLLASFTGLIFITLSKLRGQEVGLETGLPFGPSLALSAATLMILQATGLDFWNI